jgi:hypothetical protein
MLEALVALWLLALVLGYAHGVDGVDRRGMLIWWLILTAGLAVAALSMGPLLELRLSLLLGEARVRLGVQDYAYLSVAKLAHALLLASLAGIPSALLYSAGHALGSRAAGAARAPAGERVTELVRRARPLAVRVGPRAYYDARRGKLVVLQEEG